MSAILPANAQSSIECLPGAWMEKLFNVMEDRYGSMWADRYGAFPRARVMQTWGRDLADMTRDELAHGVEICRDLRFPPTLPEFRELCRPSINHERAFIEAVEQQRLRETGKDKWSSPVIYWAAVSIGKDLQNHPYSAISKRWAAALDKVRDRIKLGELPNEVPPRMEALPSPGKTTISQEQATENIALMKAMLEGTRRAFAME